MLPNGTLSSIWKSALRFALFGPLVGYAIVVLVLLVTAIRHRNLAPPDVSLISLLLTPYLLALVGAYIVGAPAAFVVGAANYAMGERGQKIKWIVVANVLLGSVISGLTIYAIDEFVMPHPHLGQAPMFGKQIWLLVSGIGGAVALICTLFVRLRLSHKLTD
jgi:hypothetical protein